MPADLKKRPATPSRKATAAAAAEAAALPPWRRPGSSSKVAKARSVPPADAAGPIVLHVRMADTLSTFPISLHNYPFTKVWDIKQNIHAILGIPTHHQQLFFLVPTPVALEDNGVEIRWYGIKDGAEIRCISVQPKKMPPFQTPAQDMQQPPPHLSPREPTGPPPPHLLRNQDVTTTCGGGKADARQSGVTLEIALQL